MSATTTTLLEKYEEVKRQNPKMRIRDIAKHLQSSEAELLATGIGSHVTLLEGDFENFLKEVSSMGKVMALTRNDHCVHERKGVYNNVSFENHVGLVLDPDIDLRLFMMHWKYGFAVNENDRFSFQFFDKSGEAVHKIYMIEQSDMLAYERIKAAYTAPDQSKPVITEAYKPTPAEKPDSEIDVAGFRDEWKNMTDTHQFFGITRKYGVSRVQALRLAPEGFVQEVSNDTTERLLQYSADKQVPIMIFVGSRGCIQIHTGEINKLMRTGPWYNILDPELNLHLRTDMIARSFIVKKPSEAGIVTALEVFDKEGNLIVQFFGKRKPGIPELESWREAVETVVSGKE
ncbi:MAG: hypothetical protein KF862_19515 [Chitinophagaceae bacterium]|nr:hypothetical protein [Chitinophagaceae bacterium]